MERGLVESVWIVLEANPGKMALNNRPTKFASVRYRFFDSSFTRIFSTASFSSTASSSITTRPKPSTLGIRRHVEALLFAERPVSAIACRSRSINSAFVKRIAHG